MRALRIFMVSFFVILAKSVSVRSDAQLWARQTRQTSPKKSQATMKTSSYLSRVDRIQFQFPRNHMWYFLGFVFLCVVEHVSQKSSVFLCTKRFKFSFDGLECANTTLSSCLVCKTCSCRYTWFEYVFA